MSRIAVERHGSGPALVLIHPLGADRTMWGPVLGRLAAEREVVLVDMPGFGGSPALDAGTEPAPAALARAIAAGLDGVVEAPFHAGGNSLGGWVALELGLAGHARTVTAIAPAGLWPEPLLPRRNLTHHLARLAGPLLGPLVRTARGRRVALGGSIARPERVPPRAALHLARAYGTAPGFRAVNAAMRARRFTALADIRVPVTLGWPEHDGLVDRPRMLPAAVHNVDLPGCGHLPTWDDPDRVAALLLEGSARA